MDINKKLATLTAISPVDGRYWNATNKLTDYFSEYALIKKRFEIEVKYLIYLSEIRIAPKINLKQRKALLLSLKNFSLSSAKKIKDIEKETNHDVKAVEYYLHDILEQSNCEHLIPYTHLFLTSDDINNVCYRLLIKGFIKNILNPTLNDLDNILNQLVRRYRYSPILARTHGQPAVPTTFGKELEVFRNRIENQQRKIRNIKLVAKFGGAVGNWNANHLFNPKMDWIIISKTFLKNLGLEHNYKTTQIAPPEDLIEIFQTIGNINSIILDLDKDMWQYISDGWVTKNIISKEVGSSTMPQKVNPINFENSEGNISIANSLLNSFSENLPISRLQRDLSDSTISRNYGLAFAHSLIAYTSTIKGLSSISLNEEKTIKDLNNDWSILTEAAQTLLRLSGEKKAYQIIAKKTKGKTFTKNSWKNLIKSLNVDKRNRKKLMQLTPESYLGLIKKITENR